MSRSRGAITRNPRKNRVTRRRVFRTEAERRAAAKEILKILPEDGPGVAVLVMDKDTVVLSEGHGKARIGKSSEKITEQTVFDLASLSKQFTALGILMLIDRTTKGTRPDGSDYQGLSFDTRLSRFFPDIPGAKEIRVRHLLNHSSGLPEYYILREKDFNDYYSNAILRVGRWYATMRRRKSHITNRDVIELLEKHNHPRSRPGRAYAYNNTGYVLLAELIKEVSGKPLSLFLKEEVFDRLGMCDTFVFDDEHQGFTRHALCYRKSDEGGRVRYKSISGNTRYNCIHGDGNVHSTLSDLAKWLKAWNEFDDRRKTHSRLIKRSTFLKTYKPGLSRMIEPSSTALRRYNYRSGMFIYRYKNKRVNSYAIHHGGSWLGFNSYLMRGHVYPVKKKRLYELTILILSNYVSEFSKIDKQSPFNIGREISKVYWQLQDQARYNVLRYYKI